MDKQQFLRRQEVPDYLKQVWGLDLRAQTLANLSSQGRPPRSHRVGRYALYDKTELDAYARGLLGPLLQKKELTYD